jgi:hypothetical protein
MQSVTALPSSDGSRAERQPVAAADRHREAVFSMQELARPAAGRHVDARVPLAAVDFDDLHDRLETAWRSWRQPLEHHEP